MATTLPEIHSPKTKPDPVPLPDWGALEDRTPQWLKTPGVFFGFTVLVGLIFCFHSYRPLWHTDLWGHLAYGRLIWQTGQLPQTEPFMPLASGMPVTDSAWLSQLAGFGVFEAAGVPGLQFLYAAGITLCVTLLLWRFYNRTESAGWSVAGLALFLLVNWQQLLIVRPQLAGLVCFCSLLVLLTARQWSRWNWVLVPTLFVIWANLHGSFPVGLAMLGCFVVGRAADVMRRSRKIGIVFRDQRLRRNFLLFELAAVAVLLNPYGLALYAEVFSFSSNPNLADLVEWKPLTLRMKQGQAAAMAVLALLFLYRYTPRRVSCTEVLLLLGLGAGALWTSRLIVWWGVMAAYYVVLHGAAVSKRLFKKKFAARLSPRRGTWTVASLGTAWIFFAYTPFGVTLLDGKPPKLSNSVSAVTPLGAVNYLKKHPPTGQIFNPMEWGDYFVWDGPENLQIFTMSHAHLVPQEVWDNYMSVIHVSSGWESLLERYSVNTVVADPKRQRRLVERLRDNDAWRVGYEDKRAIVLVREKTI